MVYFYITICYTWNIFYTLIWGIHDKIFHVLVTKYEFMSRLTMSFMYGTKHVFKNSWDQQIAE